MMVGGGNPVNNDSQSSSKNPSDSMTPLLNDVDREGLIRLLDFILQKQVDKQPLTALEVHRHFLESTKGSKVALALGGKKLLQQLETMEIIRLRKQVGKVTVQCMELTEKGAHYLQKLRNYSS